MAIAETQVYMPQAPRPRIRLLEDERWLAFVLMVPTMVLLLLFIAYPFGKGVELSVTDAKVGVPGTFVGLHNFADLMSDTIFRRAVWNSRSDSGRGKTQRTRGRHRQTAQFRL